MASVGSLTATVAATNEPALSSTAGVGAAEVWHHRLVLFSVTTTFALGVEVGYAQLVPKLPPLYAMLLRAAVWDCVVVGVLVAQVCDLSSMPILAGTDGGHYLPVAVLLYHALKMTVCLGYDLCNRPTSARGRHLHRSLVGRRVLLELAGGTTGRKLLLGRVCFMVSGGAMWLALRVLLWVDDGTFVLSAFVVLLHASYCAAGFAALEPRRTANSRRLVQWLCTGWGSREAFLQGPLKIFGGLFLLPFVVSILAAQIWLKAVALIVWLCVAWPCCRLQRADNVFDAFEREMAVPLLQCSFLAFGCTLAAMVIGFGQLTGLQRTLVSGSAVYYTAMLLFWTAPAVLQEKVGAEEAFEAAAALGEEGQTQPLRGDRHANGESDVELEDIRATCEELRALLYRERHDRSVEAAQLQDKIRDHEIRARSGDRAFQDAKRDLTIAEEQAEQLRAEVALWRERCNSLSAQLAAVDVQRPKRPEVPRLQLPVPTPLNPAGSAPGYEGGGLPPQPQPQLAQAVSSPGESSFSSTCPSEDCDEDARRRRGSSGDATTGNAADRFVDCPTRPITESQSVDAAVAIATTASEEGAEDAPVLGAAEIVDSDAVADANVEAEKEPQTEAVVLDGHEALGGACPDTDSDGAEDEATNERHGAEDEGTNESHSSLEGGLSCA